MTVHPGTLMSKEAFLAWSAGQATPYELAFGRVSPMMTPVSRAHNEITSNIIFALRSQLDRSIWRVGFTDFGLETPESIRQPDVFVEPAGGDRAARVCRDPAFICEVLSASTQLVDLAHKPREYFTLDSLRCYLVVGQEKREAWVWVRFDDGSWPAAPLYLEGDGTIELPNLSVALSFDLIFEGVF